MNENKSMTTAGADARAKARELEFLEAEITAARRRIDELHREQVALQVAVGAVPKPAVPGLRGTVNIDGTVYTTGTVRGSGMVAGVLVDIEAVDGELVIRVGRFDPAAGQLRIDPRTGTATVVVAVADVDGDMTSLGRRSYLDICPDPVPGASLSPEPGLRGSE